MKKQEKKLIKEIHPKSTSRKSKKHQKKTKKKMCKWKKKRPAHKRSSKVKHTFVHKTTVHHHFHHVVKHKRKVRKIGKHSIPPRHHHHCRQHHVIKHRRRHAKKVGGKTLKEIQRIRNLIQHKKHLKKLRRMKRRFNKLKHVKVTKHRSKKYLHKQEHQAIHLNNHKSTEHVQTSHPKVQTFKTHQVSTTTQVVTGKPKYVTTYETVPVVTTHIKYYDHHGKEITDKKIIAKFAKEGRIVEDKSNPKHIQSKHKK